MIVTQHIGYRDDWIDNYDDDDEIMKGIDNRDDCTENYYDGDDDEIIEGTRSTEILVVEKKSIKSNKVINQPSEVNFVTIPYQDVLPYVLPTFWVSLNTWYMFDIYVSYAMKFHVVGTQDSEVLLTITLGILMFSAFLGAVSTLVLPGFFAVNHLLFVYTLSIIFVYFSLCNVLNSRIIPYILMVCTFIVGFVHQYVITTIYCQISDDETVSHHEKNVIAEHVGGAVPIANFFSCLIPVLITNFFLEDEPFF